MCMSCFPQTLRDATYKAAKAAGMRGEQSNPFPVGSVSKGDWERGMEDGNQERMRQLVKRMKDKSRS